MIYRYLVFSILYLVFFLFASYQIPDTIYAIEATPSGKVLSASPSSTLQQKIEELKREVASKAASLKTEVNKKLQNKAFAGTVLDKTDSKITLETRNGQRTVLINEYTEYKQASSKKANLTLKNITKGDFVIALGDVDDKNILTAKKVLKSAPPKETNLTKVWGQVQTLNNPNIEIKTRNNKKIIVNTTPATILYLGDAEAQFSDTKVNKFLVAVGTKSEDLTRARFVYLIPSVGYIKMDKPKVATKSASPSSSSKTRN